MTFYFDEALHLQFKLRCVADGRNMSDVVQELVRAWVEKDPKSKPTKKRPTKKKAEGSEPV
ncbi:MAG: hypothetical protein HY791_10005 [Deltaproteobacteria bacterium]|nr:hypothetical protein [Deltaproteobacteria bacterium]